MVEAGRSPWRVAIPAMVIFALLSLAASATSEGFLDADAASHFLYARYAFQSLFYLTSPWGRPLPTFLYAIGVLAGGRFGAQTVSLLCALGCGLVAWRIAAAQNVRRPVLALLFTLGQPLLFLHSFSIMTELPFALVTGLAFIAYISRRFLLLAALASLLPLARPEGFGFCILAAVALIAQRRAVFIPILAIPTILWNFAGWYAEGRHGAAYLWLVHSFPYSSVSDYPRGYLLRFVAVLPMLVSPAAMPAVILGARRALRGSSMSIFIAAIPLGVLLVHSVLHWLGRFSSNGELRYLLIAAPFWAVLAADGWENMCDRLGARRPIALAAFALLLPAGVNWVVPIVPVHFSPAWQSARRVVDWYETSGVRDDYPHLLFTHPAIDYFLNAPPDDPVRRMAWTRQSVLSCPAGTILIWDNEFATQNADPQRDVTLEQITSAGWSPAADPPDLAAGWRLFVSTRQATPYFRQSRAQGSP